MFEVEGEVEKIKIKDFAALDFRRTG